MFLKYPSWFRSLRKRNSPLPRDCDLIPGALPFEPFCQRDFRDIESQVSRSKSRRIEKVLPQSFSSEAASESTQARVHFRMGISEGRSDHPWPVGLRATPRHALKPTLFGGLRRGDRRSARDDRRKFLAIQAGAPHQSAADLGQREDRARIRWFDRAAIEDKHVFAPGAQCSMRHWRMCACM